MSFGKNDKRAIRLCLVLDVAQLYHAVIVQWRRAARAVAVSQHPLRPSVQIVNIILAKTSINNLLYQLLLLLQTTQYYALALKQILVWNFVLLGVVV